MAKKAKHQLVVPTKMAPVNGHSSGLSTIDVLDLIPEEQVWLDGLKSENTRRAYKLDVTSFANVLRITNREQLYAANHKAVTYWQKYMREMASSLRPFVGSYRPFPVCSRTWSNMRSPG